MKLSPKQQAFADNFIKSGNKYQSAINAGYSKSYARSHAEKLSENVGIKAYIARRLEELKSAAVADQQEVLEFLTRLVRRQEMEQVVVTLKKPVSIPMHDKEGKTYSKFAYEDVDDVVDVKTKNSDALKAADILSKLQGMGDNANNTLTKNQSRKSKAEADIMEAKASAYRTPEGQDGGLNKLLAAIDESIPKDGDVNDNPD
ncbi:terminase small subunit [Lacticaseibacillus paracasei]|uniref:terminase small subunit n=1 Tax=Lacticaseibacillus paracasei TaxID=1597 RepID=UPI000E5C5B0E|nr:terminase small subunit [Lacticaseibacillus paracasei]MCT3368987.1 terminase small subunit [Lacticaseibacillus paracasei]